MQSLNVRDPVESTPRTRGDARLHITLCFAFIVAVVATPPGAWGWLAIEAWLVALALGWSNIALSELLQRGRRILIVAAFLGALVGLGHPARAGLGLPAVAAFVAAKSLLSVSAVLTLATRVPRHRLLDGLRRLGLPTAIVTTLYFMSRYMELLADECHRMMSARRARVFRRTPWGWVSLGRLVATLFVRAFDRAERVEAAMRARGWNGDPRALGFASERSDAA